MENELDDSDHCDVNKDADRVEKDEKEVEVEKGLKAKKKRYGCYTRAVKTRESIARLLGEFPF